MMPSGPTGHERKAGKKATAAALWKAFTASPDSAVHAASRRRLSTRLPDGRNVIMNANAVAEILGRLDRELWVVTAQAGSRRGGLIATFVSSASLVTDLPRMLVGLAKQHYTWELIEESGAFALHLFAEEQIDWVWRFGLASGRAADKLDGLTVSDGATGSPLLTQAVAWLDCRVEARLDTGDRTVYLAEVVDGALLRSAVPLSVQRLLQLAPADQRTALKEAVLHDAVVDAAAIRAWRGQLTSLPPGESSG
jgi:flavin reductase (DIM6/NTAB) family NADH-FMN oxidoreductase RutF